MNKPVNLAIIGLGYWGPNFTRLCFEIENVNLKYCCDLDQRALGKIKKQYPSVKTIRDYREIIKDRTIQGVIVVTPAETHYKICQEILAAKKDVLVEKPIALKNKEVTRLINLAQKNKRILMVDHIFQYNSAIRELKEIIKKGILGKIFYLSGSYTALGPIRGDVNALYDLAPHHFYILNYLLDKKPLWISAFGQNYLGGGKSDVAFITLAYPQNILAKIHVSWLYPFKVRDLAIIGKKKMVFFDDTSPDEKLKIFDKSAFYDTQNPEYPAVLKVVYREGDIIVPHLEPKEPLKEILLHFRDCLISREEPETAGEEGRVVVMMLEAAQKSLKEGGKRIKL